MEVGVNMRVWAAAATAGCVVFIVIIIMVLRQVREICRRLAFIRTHNTNLRLAWDMPFGPMKRLIEEINAFLTETAAERLAFERESRGLKDSLTGISHDIRTPLTSLSGYFQLLTRTEDPEERERYCAVIRARINSLESMLEELFTYTKLQNNDYRIEMDTMDFTRCAIDAVLAFYGQFAERGIKPSVKMEEDAAYIYGNPEAVRRILQNIIKNALVHGAGEVSVLLRKEREKVVFACSNRCESPEEIDIEGVFQKFYKADSARADSSTGLGLTIASELTAKLGGELTAKLERDIFTVSAVFPLMMIRS